MSAFFGFDEINKKKENKRHTILEQIKCYESLIVYGVYEKAKRGRVAKRKEKTARKSSRISSDW